MIDFEIGGIVVAVCIGVIHGAVYGWLFFGVMLMVIGILSGVKK